MTLAKYVESFEKNVVMKFAAIRFAVMELA